MSFPLDGPPLEGGSPEIVTLEDHQRSAGGGERGKIKSSSKSRGHKKLRRELFIIKNSSNLNELIILNGIFFLSTK